ncbi:selenide, water dikinase SelD [Salinarimonas soli]|uniref:Selenide, water dikinase SelD n=1 Tax=Salinarimonas soli TaxID=1638099 RepID=A0A5B2VAB3_9HYPH|nr:selenide, water dikinase SelD [Salinarimonas soli]KAA2235535.1 selenide, water dikinase SelD [Salinarimonas soli]
MQPAFPAKDLVLVGGGHAHVHVLRSLRARPEPGVQVTLVSRDPLTPYSGMLPGLIAGHYAPAEAQIDLHRLAAACGARFLRAEAIGLDPQARRLVLRDRPPVRYDVISLDTGSTPTLDVPGAAAHAIPVKPVAPFLDRLDGILAGDGPLRLAVVGGGAGGVETVLSLAERLGRARPGATSSLTLLTRGPLLRSTNARARRLLREALDRHRVAVLEDAEVVRVDADRVACRDGREISCDHVLWVTWAGAPAWLARTGLALDERGFVAVEPSLRSTSHGEVFAVGDMAAVLSHPRPKAGVYAVRQGPPLAENLRRALRGERLRPFTPQRTALALIGTGEGRAVAARGPLAVEGRIVWRIKEAIDRRWIEGYQRLRPMKATAAPQPPSMRCGGCGAKLPASVLRAALARLAPKAGGPVVAGLDAPDDAAIVRPPENGVLLQTVDAFRPFVSDPHLFGRIAALHALGDIVAMNGRPVTALAVVGLPPMAPALLEEDLVQMLAGGLAELEAAGARLVGGHSAEAAEPSLGFAITGEGDEAALLRKGGLRPGDRLILTKPLGTGAILAGAMRGEAPAEAIEAALAAMLARAQPAVAVLAAHGARACTDVTGFGLAGHLDEMLRASGTGARLDLDAVPALPGALDMLAAGIVSTLHEANAHVPLVGAASADPRVALLFDPQTAGGLLAGVPEERAQACLAALAKSGVAAAIVGRVEAEPGLRLAKG